MKSCRFISLLSMLCLLSILVAQPPVTRIRGTITDDEGAPLPGVTITLQAPGFTPISTITSANGTFLFSAVPPGVYSIRAQLSGFAIREVQDIRAVVAQEASLNIRLSSAGEVPPPPPPPQKLLPTLDSVISQLPLGQIMYNPPTEMTEGIKERVEVRISQSLNEDLLNGLRGRGVPNVENISVSSSMKATLSGDDFNVAELSEPVQRVLSAGFTQWEWDVTPLRAGEKTLYLSVAAIFDTEYGEKAKSFPVMDKKILVNVNPQLHKIKWDTVLKYAGAIVGLIVGILGILKAVKEIKKKKKQTEAGSGT